MANEPERKAYILRRGIHDGVDENGNRRLYKAGESVLLTPTQASAFSDKFTEVNVFQAEQRLLREQMISAKKMELEEAERMSSLPVDTIARAADLGRPQDVHEPIQPGQNPPKVAADVPKTDENAQVTTGDRSQALTADAVAGAKESTKDAKQQVAQGQKTADAQKAAAAGQKL